MKKIFLNKRVAILYLATAITGINNANTITEEKVESGNGKEKIFQDDIILSKNNLTYIDSSVESSYTKVKKNKKSVKISVSYSGIGKGVGSNETESLNNYFHDFNITNTGINTNVGTNINTNTNTNTNTTTNTSTNTVITFEQSTILVSYRYPTQNDSYWNTITSLGGSQIPYTLINPNSGPGTSVNTDYTRQVQANVSVGIKNIGYVRTDYANRNTSVVIDEIDKYVNFYGRNNISGIFLDEAVSGNSQSEVDNIATFYNYIKNTYPEMLVIANPGKTITDSIAPYADIWVTSEVSANEYINNFYQPTSTFENTAINKNNIWHIVYGATPAQYQQIIELSRKRNAGWLMITDDVQPNPYDDLPTNFESMVVAINTPTIETVVVRNSTSSQMRQLSTAQSSGKELITMPRSRVDLDLTKNMRNTMYSNIESTEDRELKVDIDVIGNLNTKYKDKTNGVKYKSSSNGVGVTLSNDFVNFTLGGGAGYQRSKVRYKDEFSGIKEKIDSYQFIISGKYDVNEKVDITGVFTYSDNKHKYETETGLGIIHDAEYKSKVIDLDGRVGYKFNTEKGYIKPYIGIGVTRVSEGEIEKLGVEKVSKISLNGVLGVYGQSNIGKLDMYGNIEYDYRFSKDSYHGKRTYNDIYDISPLDYTRGVINLGIGMGYRVNDMFRIKGEYKLRETKNSIGSLGFEVKF